MSRNKFHPGDTVYVVERDEMGNVSDVSGYMFLAEVCDAVIVSPFLYEIDSLEETIEQHIEETAMDYGTELMVFPIEDCYYTREEAHEVYDAEYDEYD